MLEGGYGHRFTGWGLGDDLLGPTWAPHEHRRRKRPWAKGLEGLKFDSSAKVLRLDWSCVTNTLGYSCIHLEVFTTSCTTLHHFVMVAQVTPSDPDKVVCNVAQVVV